MNDVMQEIKAVGARYKSADFRGGMLLLHEIWAQLPEPKVAVPNAYIVIEYGVAFALKLRDLDEAWLWADRALGFKEKRQDRGEVEFLVGKVAFEAGKLDVATKQFREANQKSKGRLFLGADPKYAVLLKE